MENQTYWICNSCDDVSDRRYICKCGKSFNCSVCTVQSPLTLNTIHGQYIVCPVCATKVRTFVGIMPSRWDLSDGEGDKKYLNIEYEDIGENPAPRNFKLRFDMTDFKIEDLITGFPTYEHIGDTDYTIIDQELCFIYAIMICHYPETNLSTCNCFACYVRKSARYSSLSNALANVSDDVELSEERRMHLGLIKTYITTFLIQPPVIPNIGANILNTSFYDETPKYAATDDIIEKIKTKSVEYKSLSEEVKTKSGNTDCTICVLDFEDDTKVTVLECCSKIICTGCLLKWLSDHNHNCPLCRHEYECNDTPIAGTSGAAATAEASDDDEMPQPQPTSGVSNNVMFNLFMQVALGMMQESQAEQENNNDNSDPEEID